MATAPEPKPRRLPVKTGIIQHCEGSELRFGGIPASACKKRGASLLAAGFGRYLALGRMGLAFELSLFGGSLLLMKGRSSQKNAMAVFRKSACLYKKSGLPVIKWQIRYPEMHLSVIEGRVFYAKRHLLVIEGGVRFAIWGLRFIEGLIFYCQCDISVLEAACFYKNSQRL